MLLGGLSGNFRLIEGLVRGVSELGNDVIDDVGDVIDEVIEDIL